MESGPINYKEYLSSVPCPKCETINTRPNQRLCDKCNLPYHLRCVNLTQKASKALLTWTCRTCLDEGGGDNPIIDPTIPENLARDLPEMIANWKRHTKVLARVPKGARVAAAEALDSLMQKVVTDNDVLSWSRLFGFAFDAFKCPSKEPAPGGSNQSSLATKVRAQINNYIQTTSLPPVTDPNNISRRRDATQEYNLAKGVASKLADFNIKGAVRLVASDDSFAGFSEDVTEELRRKHPPAPPNLNLPPPPDAATVPFQATKEQVVGALMSFPASSSAGPDGLRPGHLVSLTLPAKAQVQLGRG